MNVNQNVDYKEKAREDINRILNEYGVLPGFALADLAELRLNSTKYMLGQWEALGGAIPEVVRDAVSDCQGYITAYEELIKELKAKYDNDDPISSI